MAAGLDCRTGVRRPALSGRAARTAARVGVVASLSPSVPLLPGRSRGRATPVNPPRLLPRGRPFWPGLAVVADVDARRKLVGAGVLPTLAASGPMIPDHVTFPPSAT